MARRDDNILSGLFAIASQLPWRIGLGIGGGLACIGAFVLAFIHPKGMPGSMLTPVVGVIVLLIGLAFLGIVGISALMSATKGRLVGRSEDVLPYRKRDSFLTDAEREFYSVLMRAVGDHCLVFAKVRVRDIVDVPKGAPDYQAHVNRIQSKHADFVLCRRDTVSPTLVIELNDRSHEAEDRRERDAFLARVFRSAGLPLLTVPVRDKYDAAEIAGLIREALAPSRLKV